MMFFFALLKHAEAETAEGRGQFSYQPWNSRAGWLHLQQQFTVLIGQQVWNVNTWEPILWEILHRYDSMFFWPCLSMLRPKLCWRQGTILLPALEFQGWTSSWNSKSLVALAATIHSFNWSTGLDCLSPHYLRTNSVGTKCNHHVLAGLLLEQLLDGQCHFTASSWGFFRAADF